MVCFVRFCTICTWHPASQRGQTDFEFTLESLLYASFYFEAYTFLTFKLFNTPIFEVIVREIEKVECISMKPYTIYRLWPQGVPPGLGESRPPTNKFGDEWFLHGGQVTLFCFLDLKKPSSISLASFPMILIKIETVQWLLAHKNLILCLTWSILPCTLLPSWLDR